MEPPVISLEPKVRKMRWAKLTAAAVIVGAFAMGTYFYLTSRPSQTIAIVQPKQNDIAPPSVNKSILTLDDGTKIELDSTGNGTLATQGNVKIIKHSTGEISYAGTAEGVISYNTLSVPRGSKPLSLLLSDGSKVWINVGSSLRYPTAFKGSDKDKKGTTHRGYFWVYHNSIDGLVWFDYQEGRGREGPVEVLKDFKGYLQTDGYAVYDFFKEERDITVLHCLRSKIDEIGRRFQHFTIGRGIAGATHPPTPLGKTGSPASADPNSPATFSPRIPSGTAPAVATPAPPYRQNRPTRPANTGT